MTYEKIIHINSEDTFEPYVSLTLRLQRDRSIDDAPSPPLIQD